MIKFFTLNIAFLTLLLIGWACCLPSPPSLITDLDVFMGKEPPKRHDDSASSIHKIYMQEYCHEIIFSIDDDDLLNVQCFDSLMDVVSDSSIDSLDKVADNIPHSGADTVRVRRIDGLENSFYFDSILVWMSRVGAKSLILEESYGSSLYLWLFDPKCPLESLQFTASNAQLFEQHSFSILCSINPESKLRSLKLLYTGAGTAKINHYVNLKRNLRSIQYLHLQRIDSQSVDDLLSVMNGLRSLTLTHLSIQSSLISNKIFYSKELQSLLFKNCKVTPFFPQFVKILEDSGVHVTLSNVSITE